jgi:DnaA family protein
VLEGWGQLDLVCIDGLDQVVGDRQWEQALFALYNELDALGGRLAVAAQYPPQHLSFTLPDLASRLCSSLVLPLVVLDETGRCEALKVRAHERGLHVNDEVAHFILRRIRQDMFSLMSVLEILDEAAITAQRRLTVPFVREVLSQQG